MRLNEIVDGGKMYGTTGLVDLLKTTFLKEKNACKCVPLVWGYGRKNRRLMPYFIVAIVFFIIISQSGFAEDCCECGYECVVINDKVIEGKSNPKFTSTSNVYYPYVQIGGYTFFNVDRSRLGADIDFFLPLWQATSHLIYTHARFFDRFGRSLEGNLHFGYRHLSPAEDYLYGFYGAYDWKHSQLGNNFNQLTLGVEAWFKKIFIGANVYQPIGKASRLVSESRIGSMDSGRNLWLTRDRKYEKAVGGADFEVGYEFTEGLIGYLGGYYFGTENVNTIYGPKAKLSYNWSLQSGKRILGVFDNIGLNAGIQKDKVRGTIWYLSTNFRIGLSSGKNSELHGVARHMVDLVRRDVDIIVSSATLTDAQRFLEGRYIPASISNEDLAAILRQYGNDIQLIKGRIDGSGNSSYPQVDNSDSQETGGCKKIQIFGIWVCGIQNAERERRRRMVETTAAFEP